MLDKKSIELFEAFGVLTQEELESRYLISIEKYNKLVNIEGRIMHRMVKRTYLPAINAYAAKVAEQINQIKAAGHKSHMHDLEDTLSTLLKGIENIHDSLERLDSLREMAKKLSDEQKKANHNAKKLVPAMKKLRSSVDAMEHIVSRDAWPVPSYNNMLFYV